jgi:hypothetical protein
VTSELDESLSQKPRNGLIHAIFGEKRAGFDPELRMMSSFDYGRRPPGDFSAQEPFGGLATG